MNDYYTPVFVRPAWYDHANWVSDPTLFYVERGVSAAPAAAICQACEVRLDCLDLAVERGERFGMWGGFSTRQRITMRRRVASSVAVAVVLGPRHDAAHGEPAVALVPLYADTVPQGAVTGRPG